MRRWELIALLCDRVSELRALNPGIFGSGGTVDMQVKTERRLRILHLIELDLPEIIDKLKEVRP